MGIRERGEQAAVLVRLAQQCMGKLRLALRSQFIAGQSTGPYPRVVTALTVLMYLTPGNTLVLLLSFKFSIITHSLLRALILKVTSVPYRFSRRKINNYFL